MQPSPEPAPTSKKFGTFAGVFMPTVLTILGAILYLRTGWIVGNAGVMGALAIVLLANLITLSTGLSIASVATNIRVRAGGAFSIISQSLGLEVSGSVSVPFYIAQSISVGFYVFAFTEGWQYVFPNHPETLILFGVFAIIFSIALISANLASRAQYLVLAIQITSLVTVFLGTFAIFGNAGVVTTPTLWGDFPDGTFFEMFAVFFPAVTGILAGVNLSGALRDPRKSIPLGTTSAVIVCTVIYIALVIWFSYVATPDEMLGDFTLIVDKALFGPPVLAGLLAATFSAGLTSLVGAPRVLQAIAQNDVIPGGRILGKQTASGEPRPAMYVTGAITLATLIVGLLSGGLNAIAPFMTMFFLITYSFLNAVVLIEQTLGLVSFRPMFRIPRIVPLTGLVGCLVAMFLINPIFSLTAISVIIVLYAWLSRRTLTNPWGDVRSGMFVSVAEWAAKRVSDMPDTQERAWKPNLLVPVKTTEELLGNYRFLKALTYPRGSVHVLGVYGPNEAHCVSGVQSVVQAFNRDGIFSRGTTLEDDEFFHGLRMGLDTLRSAFFRPNAIFIDVDDHTDSETLNAILQRAKKQETGAILFAEHPRAFLGREQAINVWIREQSPDWEVGLRLSRLDLSLLLAYQIAHNWNGTINLITVISDPAERENGMAFLENLIRVGRMPAGTTPIVGEGNFFDYLLQAPRADLHIFGTEEKVTMTFIRGIMEKTRSSAIFVQDSGHESALA